MMPEGPEVETIRQGLLDVIGKKITTVKVANHKKYKPLRDDIKKLQNTTITAIDRKGKFLLWYFTSSSSGKIAVLNHLGMTGVWYYFSDESFSELDDLLSTYKHYKVYFELDDKTHLIFVNVRTFGRFEVMDPHEIENHPSITKLGPDILEKPFNIEEFIRRVRGKKSKKPRTKAIGKCLLDYHIVAGCGNIYKNEALFKARIHPFTPANMLDREDLITIGKSLSEVAQLALKLKGSTLQDYKHVDGYSGLMQDNFKVYDRDGENCYNCSSVIIAEKQGGRTSFYCPKCQKR